MRPQDYGRHKYVLTERHPDDVACLRPVRY
jgi:hypothetical protein